MNFIGFLTADSIVSRVFSLFPENIMLNAPIFSIKTRNKAFFFFCNTKFTGGYCKNKKQLFDSFFNSFAELSYK